MLQVLQVGRNPVEKPEIGGRKENVLKGPGDEIRAISHWVKQALDGCLVEWWRLFCMVADAITAGKFKKSEARTRLPMALSR